MSEPTYEWFVTRTASFFRYRVALYRVDEDQRVRVSHDFFDTTWGCRRWAKRRARRDRREQANGGYVARGTA